MMEELIMKIKGIDEVRLSSDVSLYGECATEDDIFAFAEFVKDHTDAFVFHIGNTHRAYLPYEHQLEFDDSDDERDGEEILAKLWEDFCNQDTE